MTQDGTRLLEQIEPKSLLIFGAVSTYVLGFLFRNQLYTRLLVVVGSCHYIAYYSITGPTPLWDAIIGSTLIALASFQGAARLLLSKLSIMVPKPDRHIWEQMGKPEPGLFRQLIKTSERITTQGSDVLVTENQPAGSLWYLVDGALSLERAGQEPTRLTNSGFVCEIAWLTGGVASATVIAEPGCCLLRWDKESLRKAVRRSQRLDLALDSLIAQDMARKLSRSRPLDISEMSRDQKPVASPLI